MDGSDTDNDEADERVSDRQGQVLQIELKIEFSDGGSFHGEVVQPVRVVAENMMRVK